MRTADFDYQLPPERIAQRPIEPRDASKLLRLQRLGGALSDHVFRELPLLLRPGDLLVTNDTRVIKARLTGRREATGGKVEVFLLHPADDAEGWMVWTRSGGRLRVGETLIVADGNVRVRILERCGAFGDRVAIESGTDLNVDQIAQQHGAVPLPPYIERPADSADEERYQTVYAREPGAVAAPTAGLHFTPELLERLRSAGIEQATVTLHVGPGTFRPVKADDIAEHEMLPERYTVSPATAATLEQARAEGRRIVAVGTTVVRTLEAVAGKFGGQVRADADATELFIYPSFKFQVIDALLTNFHLPKSTLLMLVSAFAGREQILQAYRHALANGYRFFSYGDAMLIE